ncbi:MAG: hypothetical protein V3R24_09690 [Gemmatimonadales bacterium]
MSNSDTPDWTALYQLEEVLKSVSAELASWRRRALEAEAHNAGNGGGPLIHDVATLDRIADLESENRDLLERIASAGTRARVLWTRLRFLEEQVAQESAEE